MCVRQTLISNRHVLSDNQSKQGELRGFDVMYPRDKNDPDVYVDIIEALIAARANVPGRPGASS